MQCLILSQGRDGSTSVRDVIQGFVTLNGESLSMGYLTDTYLLWPAIRSYILERNSEPLYRIFSVWNQSVEVGHGFGFVLPVVRTIFGRDLKIIRLVREPAAHVRSLVQQSQFNPEHWVGYTSDNLGEHPTYDQVVRPTGVDFGDVSAEEWISWSIERRFEWYVAKQTGLVESHIRLFRNTITVDTAELDAPSTISRIGEFLNPDWRLAPAPAHVSSLAGVDVSSASDEELHDISQVWQSFDIQKAVREPDYAVTFAVDYLNRKWRDEPDAIRHVLNGLVNANSADVDTSPADVENDPGCGK